MEQNFDKIRRLSADIRIETTRAIGTAGFGHIGGSASIADVLAVLYGGMMRIDPKNPDWAGAGLDDPAQGTLRSGALCDAGTGRLFPHGVASDGQQAGHPPSQSRRLPEDARHRHDHRFSGPGISSAVGIALGNRRRAATAGPTASWATVRPTRARSGKPAGLPIIWPWIILSCLSTGTKSSWTAAWRISASPWIWRRNSGPLVFDAVTVKGYDVDGGSEPSRLPRLSRESPTALFWTPSRAWRTAGRGGGVQPLSDL